jgi:hypothetical protein
MEITNWRFLPYSGGLLDQPDWLLGDLLALNQTSNQLREQIKPPVKYPG